MAITSVVMSEEDYKFAKDNHLPFASLMREAIQARRVVSGGYIVTNVAIERERKEKFIELSEKQREFIEKHGLIDEWLKQEGFK